MDKIHFTEQDDFIKAIDKIHDEELHLLKIKSAAHGLEDWQMLGLKGIFAQMAQKYSRIKKVIWDDDDSVLEDENIEDSLQDLSNYCNMAVAYIRKEREDATSVRVVP